MSHSPFKQELVPLLDRHPGHIKRGIFLDIFDEVEEGGRVEWWSARVGKVSLLKDMPLVEVCVVLVIGKPGGDCLGKKSVDQHSHGPGLDTVDTQPSQLHLPEGDHLLGLLKHVLV